MVYIKAKNLSLDYPIYGNSPRLFTKKILSIASMGKIASDTSSVYIRGLEDLNFELNEGDRLGLIGGNGAGKTTLLKTLAGIYKPTQGILNIKGAITTLLGFGFGLDAEATGYENIYIGALSLGHKKASITSYIKDIEEFTELGQFLSLPLRAYSAGMVARLAFAIATTIRPEILLVDEAIGVGDSAFQAKAANRIDKILKAASIMVVATHDEALLRKYCNKAIVLKSGKCLFIGGTKEAFEVYKSHYN